jgi:DNA-directed RNA polymerase specialized sigma24 family protein
MDSESSRFALLARRARTIPVAIAIGALAVGFSACGDDEQQQAQDAVDDAQQQVESALDDVDTEELQQQASEAQQSVEDAIDNLSPEQQQQLDDAQKKLEEQLGN